MTVNVHAGHNFHVPGAGGQFSETKEDRIVKDKVLRLLRAAGHTVYDCTDETAVTVNGNLQNIVRKCNEHRADLDVSIHFNAYDGTAHGTEVWVHTGSTVRGIAQRIVNNIAALGFANRGVKQTASLYVIRNTAAPALLVECCFCDSKTDAGRYDADKMAKAIAEGITGKAISSAAAGSTKDGTFVVRLRGNAPVRTKASKDSARFADGGKPVTERKGDSFTVVEVSKGGNWYRRRLGGWVAAKYCERVS